MAVICGMLCDSGNVVERASAGLKKQGRGGRSWFALGVIHGPGVT